MLNTTVCQYTQRRMAAVEDNGDHVDEVQANHLYNILFQPIAGDSTGRLDVSHASLPLLFTGMHFGILGVESINRLAVVKIKSASVAESPECLSDLRMGASSTAWVRTGTMSTCETCHMTHHNCPGHFEPWSG
jgi:hypothetical protein